MRGCCWAMMSAVVLCAAAVFAEERADPSRTYAILISGGAKQSSNHLRYWGDMALAYDTLAVDYRVPRDHIKVLWSSGNPASDLCCAGRECYQCGWEPVPDSPKDFDRDGKKDIHAAATLANVCQAFEEVKAVLTPSDQLLVFITDHGAKTDSKDERGISPHSSFLLWDGERLTDVMLARLCRDIRCPVVFAFESCYSGGAIGDLLMAAGTRFVMTADTYRESLAGSTYPYYDQWVYYFISALRGYYPKSFSHPERRGQACDADADGDGLVSFREAAKFAYRNRCSGDCPQYAESWQGCGDVLLPVPVLLAEEMDEIEAAHAQTRAERYSFRKAYELRLDSTVKSGRTSGGLEFEGEWIDISVPGERIGTGGGIEFFCRWEIVPADVELGSAFDGSSPQTEFFMPASNLRIAPVYAACPDEMQTVFAGTYSLREADGREYSISVSGDGKATMTEKTSADTCGIVSGEACVRREEETGDLVFYANFKGLEIRLAGRQEVQPPGVAVAVRDPGIRLVSALDGKAAGNVAMNPPTGQPGANGKIVLTAKASPGSVFVRWVVSDAAGEIQVGNGTEYGPVLEYDFDGNEDLFVSAEFRSRKDKPEAPVLSCDENILTNLRVGVAVDTILSVQTGARPVRFYASELPPGLSLDEVSGRLSGVPVWSRARPFRLSAVSLTDNSLRTVRSFPGKVAELPAWAAGNFFGYVVDDVEGRSRIGEVALSVGESGKVSGKFSLGGETWRISHVGYAELLQENGVPALVLSCPARSEKGGSVSVAVRVVPVDVPTCPGHCAQALGTLGTAAVELQRNIWRDFRPAPLQSAILDLAAPYAGGTALLSGNGTVTLVGLSGSRLTSRASVAFLDEDSRVNVYLPISDETGASFGVTRILLSVAPRFDIIKP